MFDQSAMSNLDLVPCPGLLVPNTVRYLVRFPDQEHYRAATAAEAPGEFDTPVRHDARAYLACELPTSDRGDVQNETDLLSFYEKEYGAEVREDYQFAMEAQEGPFAPESFLDPGEKQADLDAVHELTRVDLCWADTTGEDVVIAIVDTGVDGSRPEFPAWKQAASWQPEGDTPWTDRNGHGTMCATIAVATREEGGRFQGVAPGARLIACKTRFFDSELTAAYDFLVDWQNQHPVRMVVSNSFGVPTGSPPPPPDTLFLAALEDAIDAGLLLVFSAGNYHAHAGGHPDRCEPTTIWTYKCRADTLTVGTCNLDRSMWYYSSRGPGQHADQKGMAPKPDVVAPTPAHGEILYGGEVRVLRDGWGTSGAAPQVAGVAALLLGRKAGLHNRAVQRAIQETAQPIPRIGQNCQGRGMLDARAALDSILDDQPTVVAPDVHPVDPS